MQLPTGRLREDAAVDCANTLAAWAELVPKAAAAAMFEAAVEAYKVALAQDEDALVRAIKRQTCKSNSAHATALAVVQGVEPRC